MHALTLTEKLDFDWSELPDPTPRAGEAIINVRAAAVNRADILQKDGNYSSPPDWPQWCGLEVAGVRADNGERVCALVGGGGYSEKIAVPEELIIPIPKELTFEQAATIPEVWATAWLNLVIETGGISKNDTVFIQAGASGLGLAAIQLAKLFGARVITTVGSEEKAAFVKTFGADIVINRKTENLAKILAENPPTVALDCVAGPRMGDCLKNMQFGGKWILIASLGGPESNVPLETIWRKRLRIIGSTLRSRTNSEKGEIMKAIANNLTKHFADGSLKLQIDASFPLKDAETAHKIIRENRNIGKIVLTI